MDRKPRPRLTPARSGAGTAPAIAVGVVLTSYGLATAQLGLALVAAAGVAIFAGLFWLGRRPG